MMTATFGPGMANAVPDVCMTPPLAIPAPFPNIGMNATVVPAYFTIMINGMPELNLGCMYAITNGDQGGSFGGVASGTIMGPARCVKGSMVVFIGGMPVVRLMDPTIQNLSNCPGFITVPSQTVRIVLR